MAIALTWSEAGAIAGVEHGFAGIGDEHDRGPDDIDELVFVAVPMTLAGPGAGLDDGEVDAEQSEAGVAGQALGGLILARRVEGRVRSSYADFRPRASRGNPRKSRERRSSPQFAANRRADRVNHQNRNDSRLRRRGRSHAPRRRGLNF